MPLNPLSFDSEEEFQKALNEEGFKKGWTPILIDKIEHVTIKGMAFVKNLLKRS